MKKLPALCLSAGLLLTLCACGGTSPSGTASQGGSSLNPLQAQTQTDTAFIEVQGSVDALPLMLALSDSFMSENEGVTVDVAAVGRESAREVALSGETDLAVFSLGNGMDMPEGGVIAAYQCVAVVLHMDNTVPGLTKEQLTGLMTGDIVNWEDVGGPDGPVTLYIPEAFDALRQTIEDILPLKNTSGIAKSLIPERAEILQDSASIAQAVADDKNALGIVWAAEIPSGLKPASIDSVFPSDTSVTDGSYILSRPVVMVAGRQSEQTSAILEHAKGNAMEQQIKGLGLWPVK